MADGILVNPSKMMDTTRLQWAKSAVGVGNAIFFWKRVVKTDLGFQVKPLEKLFGSLVSSAGAPVHSPGVI